MTTGTSVSPRRDGPHRVCGKRGRHVPPYHLSKGFGALTGTASARLSRLGPGEGTWRQARRTAPAFSGSGHHSGHKRSRAPPDTGFGVQRRRLDSCLCLSRLCALGQVSQPPRALVSSSIKWGDICGEDSTCLVAPHSMNGIWN